VQVSVVIPSFNEERRILSVISVVKQCPHVNEIIVVDDGSDNLSHRILASIPDINLITHPQNLGKSQALKTGTLQARGDLITFLDADLVNLSLQHLTTLIQPVKNRQYDITLSQRDREYWKIFGNGFVVAFTGDRCLPKQLLLDNINIFDVQGYLIEASFNQRFFNSHYQTARVRFDAVGHCPKHLKTGTLVGLRADIAMANSIASYLGFKKLLKQVTFASRLPLVSSV